MSYANQRSHKFAEQPFVPMDPFKSRAQILSKLASFVEHDNDNIQWLTSPRHIYSNLHLRHPARYFSRVSEVFQDAVQRTIGASGSHSAPPALEPHDFSTLDSNEQIIYSPGTLLPDSADGLTGHVGAGASAGHIPPPSPDERTVSPALERFKHSWEALVDTQVQEWKTMNIVSTVLLSAILIMFQTPSAAKDPVVWTPTFLSLICATMSFTYGCIYIVRSTTIKSMCGTLRFAEEARKTDAPALWNVWILLAMPLVWMSWSIIFFVVSILSLLWRTISVPDPDDRPPLSTPAALGLRLAITVVFSAGMVCLVLILKTLRSYDAHRGNGGPR